MTDTTKHPGNKAQSSGDASAEPNLAWGQLSLLGIGCTIGTGYFLGSSIGITLTGASIVFAFLLAAAGTYIVFVLLAKMTAADPQEGSFCYYAAKAFGDWAGFSCGWIYWISSILIMGSQLTAISLLSQFWFEQIPLWVFSAAYALLAIIVVLLGAKSFDKVENILAVVKTAAILLFIVLAILALMGVLQGGEDAPAWKDNVFTGGFRGFWASLIYAFYAFGGIEVIGLMAMQLKNKKDAAKAGTMMLIGLAILYVASLALTVSFLAPNAFHHNESPFVTALKGSNLAFFPHVFNAAVIIAGFSALSAALFGVTNLLVTLAKDGDAPKLFQKKLKFKSLPLFSMLLASGGLIVSIVLALLMPGKLYEYITTAAGVLLLYNWLFIVGSGWKIGKLKFLGKSGAVIGSLLLLAAISGTAVEAETRPGLYVSLGFLAVVILLGVWLKRAKA